MGWEIDSRWLALLFYRDWQVSFSGVARCCADVKRMREGDCKTKISSFQMTFPVHLPATHELSFLLRIRRFPLQIIRQLALSSRVSMTKKINENYCVTGRHPPPSMNREMYVTVV